MEEHLLRVNHNPAVDQRPRLMKGRTCGGNPADREIVRPDRQRIAQNNRGVTEGSTVAQGARAAVLADSDRVLAIFLRSAKGPALPVRGIGMETKTDQLRVGMSVEDVDKVLPDQPYRFESLTDTWVPYRFYPFLGVAMQMGTDRAVQELVVVQTARR
jgi:hypothetical protein